MDPVLCLLQSWYSISISGDGGIFFYLLHISLTKLYQSERNLCVPLPTYFYLLSVSLSFAFPPISIIVLFFLLSDNNLYLFSKSHSCHHLNDTSSAIPSSFSGITAFCLTIITILISIETHYNLFQPLPYFFVLFWEKISPKSCSYFLSMFPVLPVLNLPLSGFQPSVLETTLFRVTVTSSC